MGSRYQRAGMLFDRYPPGHFKSHLFSQTHYFFSEKEISNLLLHPDFDLSGINCEFTGRNLDAVEQMSFWDLENYLKDDLLVKVDRPSMQYSLETRVPLLDYRVVEFALNPKLNRIPEAGFSLHYRFANTDVVISAIATFMLEVSRNAIREKEANAVMFDFLRYWFVRIDDRVSLSAGLAPVFYAGTGRISGFWAFSGAQSRTTLF